jgi:hypothetical protein
MCSGCSSSRIIGSGRSSQIVRRERGNLIIRGACSLSEDSPTLEKLVLSIRDSIRQKGAFGSFKAGDI